LQYILAFTSSDTNLGASPQLRQRVELETKSTSVSVTLILLVSYNTKLWASQWQFRAGQWDRTRWSTDRGRAVAVEWAQVLSRRVMLVKWRCKSATGCPPSDRTP